jgi:hypothetical protein
VAVKVDNIAAGTSIIAWQGKPQSLGAGAYACTATWSITVPVARVSYSLSITGAEGYTDDFQGSVLVPVGQASSSINMDDNSPNGNDTLEITSGT